MLICRRPINDMPLVIRILVRERGGPLQARRINKRPSGCSMLTRPSQNISGLLPNAIAGMTAAVRGSNVGIHACDSAFDRLPTHRPKRRQKRAQVHARNRASVSTRTAPSRRPHQESIYIGYMLQQCGVQRMRMVSSFCA